MKIFKILEIVWLALACIGVIMCVYNIVMKDNGGAIYFFVFAIVSGLMYALRRRQRVKFEKAQAEKENK
jgi:hypothetical protein